ncbi:MAG: hypothetical protein ABSG86_24855 [Thermoguttaceae bacterium]|jgi:hypothetical protein
MDKLRVFSFFLVAVKLLLAVPCVVLGLAVELVTMLTSLGGLGLLLGAIGLAYPFSLIRTKERVTWVFVIFSALPFSLAMGYFPITDLNAWARKALVLLLPVLTLADLLVAHRLRAVPGSLVKRGFVLGGGVLLTVVVVGAIAFFSFAGRSYHPPVAAFQGDSGDLARSVVVPTLDTPMPKGKNVIWCGTIQLGWNRLEKDILHEPPQVQGAEAVVSRLNQAQLREDDLPPDSYMATAGFVKDGVAETARAEMKRRFEKETNFDSMPPNAVLVYAYLQVNLPFRIPFFDNRGAFRFKESGGRETKVSAFGIEERHEYAYHELREQIDVLYSSRKEHQFELDEFVLDPCRDSSPCQIVLACVPPKETLLETLRDVEKKTQEHARQGKEEYHNRFGVRDVLLVPNLEWEIRHHFAELEGNGKRFLNATMKDYFIGKAAQTIRFKLDRSGAELASESKLYCLPLPTYFVFDRPFLIVVKKRGSERPFFVMWVDNAELLCRP